MKRMLTMMAALSIMGMGLTVAAAQSGSASDRLQNRLRSKVLFVDENGDGICDFYQASGKAGQGKALGSKNARAGNGQGSQYRKGEGNSTFGTQERRRLRDGTGLSNRAFRNSQGPYGPNGTCSASRSGRRSRGGGKR